MTTIESTKLNDLVLKGGPNGILLFVDVNDRNDALLYFQIEFPHYIVQVVQHSLTEHKGVAILGYPPTSATFADKKNLQPYVESMNSIDYRFTKINWHLSLNSFAQFFSRYRRIVLTTSGNFGSDAFQHFSKLKWSGISQRGTKVAAFFEESDLFDMSAIDPLYCDLDVQRFSKILPKPLPEDVAQFDFSNWTVDSSEKSLMGRMRNLFY